MDAMDFGVLSDMPNIRKKASNKLLGQQVSSGSCISFSVFRFASGKSQFGPRLLLRFLILCHFNAWVLIFPKELYRGNLLSSYRDMVGVLTHMVKICKSMRCYFRGTSSSPLAQFSFSSDDGSDSGDCGGIPVFTFCSIASFEELAMEIARMFISELNLKRLLVMEFQSIYDEKVAEAIGLQWSDELYEGEFDDLATLNLYTEKTHKPNLPSLRNCNSSTSNVQSKQQQDSNVLQIYITTWLAEVNIDKCRVDEIFGIVGGEMHVDFLETSG